MDVMEDAGIFDKIGQSCQREKQYSSQPILQKHNKSNQIVRIVFNGDDS